MKPAILLISFLMAATSVLSGANNDCETTEQITQSCLRAAESGDQFAQLLVGKIYIREKNYEQAKKWFLAAADQGNANAMYNVGVMYDDGLGVKSDFNEAAQWYRKAADLCFASAQFNLGVMYEYGQAVPQDLARAHEYYLLAAEQGEPSAQFALGLLYDKGLGVEVDFRKAYMWWAITGDGYLHAKHNLASISEDMTAQQISEAKKMASDWLAAHEGLEQLPPQQFAPGFN